jgi:hypothetical protein
LYPQLRQKGKILVLTITTDLMALPIGTQSTLKHLSRIDKLVIQFSGTDFVILVNYVDYFYARTYGFRGLWDGSVQYDTPFGQFVRLLLNKCGVRF